MEFSAISYGSHLLISKYMTYEQYFVILNLLHCVHGLRSL